MAMNSYRVIKRLDVFEYESISMMIVTYTEAIQPFPLNQSVERLDAGVVVRIAVMFAFEDDHVVINSQKDAAAFIKMLNDDIVRSELTGQEYDSPSKSALEPQE